MGSCKEVQVVLGKVEGLQGNGPGLVWGHGKSPGVGAGWGCLQGAVGGWSSACSDSLSQGLGLHWGSHKTTSTALRVPRAHPSLALECPPTLLGLGGAPGAAACGAAVHIWLPGTPVPAGGQRSNFPSPSPTTALLPARAPQHNPREFPCEPQPCFGCNYCAWQLLPSATARVCSSVPHPRRFPGIGGAAALPGGVTQHGRAWVAQRAG